MVSTLCSPHCQATTDSCVHWLVGTAGSIQLTTLRSIQHRQLSQLTTTLSHTGHPLTPHFRSPSNTPSNNVFSSQSSTPCPMLIIPLRSYLLFLLNPHCP